jgi:GNAT superfamily N-acetyltransferase
MVNPPTYSIQRVAAEEIIDLRHSVLRSGLPRQSAIFPGDDDPKTIHLAAIENGKIIGCATALENRFEDQPALQVRGMAVDPAHHRRGIGRLLSDRIERLAAEQQIKLLWANCRTPAVPFYAKAGWSVVSDEFLIPTAGPHFKMIRRL